MNIRGTDHELEVNAAFGFSLHQFAQFCEPLGRIRSLVVVSQGSNREVIALGYDLAPAIASDAHAGWIEVGCLRGSVYRGGERGDDCASLLHSTGGC